MTEGRQSGGDANFLNIRKYDYNNQFVEGFGTFSVVVPSVMQNIKPGNDPNCLIGEITQYVKDPSSKSFEPVKDEKSIWKSPYNNCPTPGAQQKGQDDQMGNQIFQSKFLFDVSSFDIEKVNLKEIKFECQNFVFEKKGGDWKFLWQNQQIKLDNFSGDEFVCLE